MDWVKWCLLEMTAGHGSCPRDLSAAEAPDAPEKQNKTVQLNINISE